ncbi:hypothetical protein [Streptomyces sp. NPDC002491]
MGFLAGETLTAARLNRLQTKTDGAIGSGTVAVSQTNADVPSATVTMVTETAGARYKVIGVWDFSASGAPGGTSTGRLAIDGAAQSPLVTFGGTASGDRGTQVQEYTGTLGAAGSHTFKLIATTNTNTTVQGVNSSVTVDITEVV